MGPGERIGGADIGHTAFQNSVLIEKLVSWSSWFLSAFETKELCEVTKGHFFPNSSFFDSGVVLGFKIKLERAFSEILDALIEISCQDDEPVQTVITNKLLSDFRGCDFNEIETIALTNHGF